MAGEDGITFNQLRKMAEYFGRGVLFFLEMGRSMRHRCIHHNSAHLPTRNQSCPPSLKKLIERVEKQRAVYLSLLEDLDETEQLRFNPPKLPHKDLREAARIARKWLGLADENNFETYRVAVEARGVLVFRSNGYNGKWQIPKQNPILGFTLYDSTCPVIVIKKQPWEPQQSFTLMHELGHLLLHKASSIDDEHDLQSHQGRERDANAFAGHLLVPDVFLASIRDAERPDEVSQYDEWLERPTQGMGREW